MSLLLLLIGISIFSIFYYVYQKYFGEKNIIDPEKAKSVKVIVIGAGFSGLCAGYKLDRSGLRDYVILEKRPEVGGTWYDNTYPGAACDIASVLYSFSFYQNPK